MSGEEISLYHNLYLGEKVGRCSGPNEDPPDLTAAKEVIADHRDKFACMANMFDMMIETTPNVNPALVSRWQSLRPSFFSEPTPEEQADLERRADEHSSDLFDEINLNT
ncbi:hypothetical protein YC2023_024300 [Brassica napus]